MAEIGSPIRRIISEPEPKTTPAPEPERTEPIKEPEKQPEPV